MKVSLLIDDETIELNDFTNDFLGGMLKGAVSSLHGINKDWTELEIKIKR